jgi:hypothetical protein
LPRLDPLLIFVVRASARHITGRPRHGRQWAGALTGVLM